MAFVFCQDGEKIFLEAGVNKAAGQDLLLKLFTNSAVTPANGDTAGTYTEPTFAGYAAISLAGASWVTTPGNPTQIAYAQQTFTGSGTQATQSVYGYFIVQTTSGKLIGAEKFSDGPYAFTFANDNVKVTPKLTGQ